MSQGIVPNWNLKHQRQEQVEEGDQIEGAEERINRSSQHANNTTITTRQHQQHNTTRLIFPMSKYEVAEQTWENGQLQLAMYGLGGLLPTTPTMPTWGRSNDTLESIVHQAACHNNNNDITLNSLKHDQKSPEKMSSARVQMPKKRTRADSNQCGRRQEERSGCGSATFCRDNDTTTRSLKTKFTTDEDSACHGGSENQDEDHETKMERDRSRSLGRSRVAAIHNQSERRRRDRINQKMKALQRLVPNASKTDKASMLDEVMDYLKQLQAQVQMMSARNLPQMNMIMPLGMQQHLQMSLLARMGMGVGLGMGMGMFDINTMAAAAARSAPQSLPLLIHPTAPVSATTPAFVPSPFMVAPMIATCLPAAQANSEPGDASTSVPLPDSYCAFLAQSMNMELYNKMVSLYRQQVNQTTQQATSSPSTQSDHMQGD